MEKLKLLYTEYARQLEEAREKAPKFSGILGIGDVVKNHPCHQAFYEGVGRWTEEFLASEPSEADTVLAVRQILEQGAGDGGTSWYCVAAQGHAKPLISRLSRENRQQLLDWYQTLYPRRKRLPVQEDVCRLLKK